MVSTKSYEYANRVCARLPGRLRELREAMRISCYELAIRCGVTRAMIGRIESGKSIPTMYVTARIAAGLGTTLAELVGALEEKVEGRGQKVETGRLECGAGTR